MSSLQPRVEKIEVGIRRLREVSIYPLSVAQQLKAKDIITNALSKMSEVEGTATNITVSENLSEEFANILPNAIFGNVIIDTIEDSLSKFLEMSTDPEDEVTLDVVSNEQAVDIATSIYRLNYEGALKKLKGLKEKVTVALGKKTPAGPQNQSLSTES